MDNCDFDGYDIYNVPAISFIGGSKQEYNFSFYESDLVTPTSMIGAVVVRFKLTPYGYSSNVVIDIAGERIVEEPYNVIRIIIPDNLTQNLYGKFVYQIVIESYNGGNFIPVQGIMNITRKFAGTILPLALYLPE